MQECCFSTTTQLYDVKKTIGPSQCTRAVCFDTNLEGSLAKISKIILENIRATIDKFAATSDETTAVSPSKTPRFAAECLDGPEKQRTLTSTYKSWRSICVDRPLSTSTKVGKRKPGSNRCTLILNSTYIFTFGLPPTYLNGERWSQASPPPLCDLSCMHAGILYIIARSDIGHRTDIRLMLIALPS